MVPLCTDVNTETASHLPVPVATSLPNPSPATPTLVTISPPTAQCEYGNQVYEHGASWNPNSDPCTTCYCDDGFHFCIAQSCYAPCDQNDLVFLPGICCPLCPGMFLLCTHSAVIKSFKSVAIYFLEYTIHVIHMIVTRCLSYHGR